MEWKPIETAPKDGTHVIAYRPTKYGEHIESMYFDDDGWFFSFDGEYGEEQPTHWIPRPAAPKEGSSDDRRHLQAPESQP
ncbi:Uncharacterised protein [Chromobacterium violaceum]|uniref:DUF551 domain-containing protein n=1 Tax=Chromobacterium violaceum TaxID=536 RepID=A0A447TDH8_CHRVL|nr:Uncharacterised protein [Chromobacterium violaceum]